MGGGAVLRLLSAAVVAVSTSGTPPHRAQSRAGLPAARCPVCGVTVQSSTVQYSTAQNRTVKYSTVIHSMWVVAALLVAGLVSRLQALLLARVTVPPFGLGGAAASLGCEYDPQGDAVYSVKWYKVSSRLVPGC